MCLCSSSCTATRHIFCSTEFFIQNSYRMNTIVSFCSSNQIPKQTLHRNQLVSEMCSGKFLKQFYILTLVDPETVGVSGNITGIAGRYPLDGQRLESRKEQKFSRIQTRPVCLWGPPCQLFKDNLNIFPWIDFPGLQVNHSRKSSAKFMNYWSYTCLLSHVYKAWTGV